MERHPIFKQLDHQKHLGGDFMGTEKVDTGYITQYEVDQYYLLNPLINGIYYEFKELSKKKSETVLNVYKVKVVNRILEPIRKMLANEEVITFLDVLDQDDLPTNSDVILILNQYLRALSMFYSRYYEDSSKGKYEWAVK